MCFTIASCVHMQNRVVHVFPVPGGCPPLTRSVEGGIFVFLYRRIYFVLLFSLLLAYGLSLHRHELMPLQRTVMTIELIVIFYFILILLPHG